jgi:hypothetical protein
MDKHSNLHTKNKSAAFCIASRSSSRDNCHALAVPVVVDLDSALMDKQSDRMKLAICIKRTIESSQRFRKGNRGNIFRNGRTVDKNTATLPVLLK